VHSDSFLGLDKVHRGLENLLGDGISKCGADLIKTERARDDTVHLFWQFVSVTDARDDMPSDL